MYSLIQQGILNVKPEFLNSLDLNLLLIMFKDKNDSLLKIVFPEGNRLEFHNIPQIKKYIGVKASEPSKISRTVVKNLTLLEPPLFDFEDKLGYND